MTSSINRAITDFLTSTDYDAISTTVGLAAVVALLVLLVQREAVRAYWGNNRPRWIHGLDVAVFPLLVSFATIVLLRLLQLLPDSRV
jgi:hypothetical protein